MFNRSSGVLLNISSLPSDFGIGGFGWEVKEMCDFLIRGGFHCWQTLPITAIGMGNSPYSGDSAFALNYLYINPYALRDKGWISEQQAQECRIYDKDYQVDYDLVKQKKSTMLMQAYNNVKDKIIADLKVFEIAKGWVSDYAMFKTLCEMHNGSVWWEWDKKYVDIAAIDRIKFIEEHFDSYYYFIFEQYICDEQWYNCRQILKQNQIKIIGDIPMYVCHNSVDVWAAPKNFLLDKNYKPTKVAGVPPDYFCADGQLWGNPLYDYDYMAKTNYSWWLKRFERMFELYDILRIDHFRAFSDYWAVDSNQTTAKNGKWCKGVGMKLLSHVIDKFGQDCFIAEDLGIIDKRVEKLLSDSKLLGMRVMQFGFEDGDSIHLPHNFKPECVAYTATHDNNTTLGWAYSLPPNIIDYVCRYIECEQNNWKNGGYDSTFNKAFVKRLIASCAKLSIIPMQDLCGYGENCRMNTPGLAEGNWTFRATKEAFDKCDSGYYHYLNSLYGRNLQL